MSKNLKFESLISELNIVPLISMIYRTEQKYLDHKLKDLDIGSGQINCLMKIYEYDIDVHEDNLCQNDLCEILKISKGTVASSLRKLEDNGYVIREPIPNNMRKYKLSLTKKGFELVPKIIEIDKMWENDMDCKFINEELKGNLRKILLRSLELTESL
ncbi:MAG: ArsR family transcriptional regulator [Methanobacteriaceae archaeon]|nr:ArsR family transcriptional regulator [Methanobacteriaceae archaeon]